MKNIPKKGANHPQHESNAQPPNHQSAGKDLAATNGHQGAEPRVHYRQSGDYLMPAGANPVKK